MKSTSLLIIMVLISFGTLSVSSASAQVCEWRLAESTFQNTDPDGAGPALGIVTFKLQIRTTSGTIPNVTVITTGYSYQSANAMLPIACPPTVSSPSNIVLSPEFLAGGYAYTFVNQCNVFAQNNGTFSFDRTAAGTLDASGSGVTLTTAWLDVFTVTLWTLSPSAPQGGYAVINSGAGGSPAQLGSYAISDALINEYVVNSLTWTNALALPSGSAPVLFSQFKATCSPNGTLINWKTAQESNSSYFEVERSVDGNTWVSLGRTAAAGNSSTDRSYNQIDLEAGNAMYRVKQVDKDGQFIYTGIERANCQVKNITSVIYPVPAQSELNVVIKSDRALNTQLIIFDATGRAVRRENVNIQNGSNNFKINLNGLSSGEYLLKSTNVELDLRKQFSIIR